jgi:hypothetical protein
MMMHGAYDRHVSSGTFWIIRNQDSEEFAPKLAALVSSLLSSLSISLCSIVSLVDNQILWAVVKFA